MERQTVARACLLAILESQLFILPRFCLPIADLMWPSATYVGSRGSVGTGLGSPTRGFGAALWGLGVKGSAPETEKLSFAICAETTQIRMGLVIV